MDGAAAITGIWKYFRYSLKHSGIFISNDLAAAITADTNSHKGGNVLDFAAPTTFQTDIINIDIWITAG